MPAALVRCLRALSGSLACFFSGVDALGPLVPSPTNKWFVGGTTCLPALDAATGFQFGGQMGPFPFLS